MTYVSTHPRRLSPEEGPARLGQPEPMVRAKVKDRVDDCFRFFIAHSPFLTTATEDAAGRAVAVPADESLLDAPGPGRAPRPVRVPRGCLRQL